ncbi:Ldh family oxidoreductase [Brevibacillus marinus]|uniref:Ldh family oxidoreductase n=1 Tax=Brevibacillus marinus TaxID=2496837 RepID=UPI000F828D62|nr:Ldh family oxidoreductase [Brevibacillus marinus]
MEKKMVKAEDLLRFAARLLEQSGGLRREDAVVIAQDLVEANLRGLDSHGVSRIPMYLERIRRGVVNPQPNIKVTNITAAVSLVDGDNGMGFLAAHRAMDEAIELAENSGIGLVGVRNSTHFGMAALYVKQAIRAGYIGLAYTNSSPAIPVWGGRAPFLGASPFAAGVPAGQTQPYVLDMAMTVIARGKIRLAAMHGEPIPLGLALDKDGVPTTDAKKAFEGVCLPFGGVKGAALAMLMDLLAGVLTGANYGGDVKSLYFDYSGPQNVGHLFFAIRPDLFVSREEFAQRMDTFVARVKNQPLAQGFSEIMLPGEPEERTAEERRKTGIPLTAEVIRVLREEAARCGLTMEKDNFL